MPYRSASKPLGAIRERFAGWNLRTADGVLYALLEFSQARLFQPCFFGQFQLSFPAQPSGSSPLRLWSRNAKGIPFEKRGK
jgi:hypothetical protein